MRYNKTQHDRLIGKQIVIVSKKTGRSRTATLVAINKTEMSVEFNDRQPHGRIELIEIDHMCAQKTE